MKYIIILTHNILNLNSIDSQRLCQVHGVNYKNV